MFSSSRSTRLSMSDGSAPAVGRSLASRRLGQLRRDYGLYLLLLPGIAFYILFKYVPMYGILIAFQRYSVMKGILGSKWVGLQHFQEFFNSPYAFQIIRNTFVLNIYELIFEFPAPILLACLFHELRSIGFKRVVQTISYLPHFISTVVIAGMVVNFLSPNNGIVNLILMHVFGLKQGIYFMGDPNWFRTIYISSGIWKGIGWGTILYLAAIQGIDPSLYEASRMDGANRWKQFRHVTLAGIMPVITIMFVLQIGSMLSIGAEKIILLYNPLTYETADVISSFVYRRGLLEADYSFGAAVNLFQSVVAFVLIVGANRVARRFGESSLW